MNLDIREGRTIEKRRELALKYMQIVQQNFGINPKNQYVTFTEHKGEDFHLVEKYLASWESGKTLLHNLEFRTAKLEDLGLLCELLFELFSQEVEFIPNKRSSRKSF